MMWSPILEGESEKQCWKCIHDIASALETPSDEWIPASLGNDSQQLAASLANGAPGPALFFTYLFQETTERGYLDLAFEYLNISIEVVAGMPMSPDLYGGFSGVAWTIEHIRKVSKEAVDISCLEEIDEALISLLGCEKWWGSFDVASGLVGIGVYFLERLPRRSAQSALERIVILLNGLADEAEEEMTWHTGPYLLDPTTREEFPEGQYSIGLAHGVAGVVSFLGKVHAAGICSSRCSRMMHKAVRWLRNQRLPSGYESMYPRCVVPGRQKEASRVAWCHGDLGVAWALAEAGVELCVKEWQTECNSIVEDALARPIGKTRIRDACLCHGTCGFGHILNRLYHRTRWPPFLRGAQEWFQRTFDLQRQSEGLGGFFSLLPSIDGQPARGVSMPGILMGVSGIGLGLLAAVSSCEPAWDGILLLGHPKSSP